METYAMTTNSADKRYLITDSEPITKLLCLLDVSELTLADVSQTAVDEDSMLTKGTMSLWAWRGIAVELTERDYLDSKSLALNATFTTEQAGSALAELAGFFHLPEAFKPIYSLFALDTFKIDAFTSEDHDDGYLRVSARIGDLQEKSIALLGVALPLKSVELSLLVTTKPDSYQRNIRLSLLGELQLGQQNVRVELAFPLYRGGAWVLRMLPPGVDISLTSLVEAFGVEASSLPALPDEINAITSFTLGSFYLRFDPFMPKLYEISFALRTNKEWKLIDPGLSIKEIGLDLRIYRQHDDSWGYQGLVYGTSQIGKLEVSAEVPIPLTGIATLQASTNDEKIQLADFEPLLGFNPSTSLPAGFADTALQLERLLVSVDLGKRALKQFSIAIHADTPWPIWQDKLSLNYVDVALSLENNDGQWLSSGRIAGSGALLNRTVVAEVNKNVAGQWRIALTAPYELGDVGELLQLTNIDVFDPNTTALPAPLQIESNLAISIRKLYLAVDNGTVASLGTDIRTTGKLTIQNNLALSDVRLLFDVTEPFNANRTLSAEIAGVVSIGKHPFALRVAHPDAETGWHFSGQSEPGDKIALVDTLTLFIPDYQLEEEWRALTVSDLALAFAPTQQYFLARGRVELAKQIIDGLQARFLLDLAFERKDAKYALSFKGQAAIDLQAGTAEAPETARLLANAYYNNTDGWGFAIQTSPPSRKISLKTVCQNLLQLDTTTCPDVLQDLQIKGLKVSYASQPYQMTCAGSAELALLIEQKPVKFALDADLKCDAEKKLTGTLAGRCQLGSLDLGAKIDLADEAVASLGLLEPLAVNDLVEEWVGTSMPAELPDIDFSALAGTLNLTTKEFTFSGATTIAWDFLQNGSTLETSIGLSCSRKQSLDPANPYRLACALNVATTGELKLTDGIHLRDFDFKFALDGQQWGLDGGLKVSFLSNTFAVKASYDTQDSQPVMKLEGRAEAGQTPITLGPLSLGNAFFNVTVAQPKDDQPKQITGSLGFSFGLADSTFEVSAAYGETLSFATAVENLSLSKLCSAVLNIDRPAELPEIVFKKIDAVFVPAKQMFTFAGEISGNWQVDAGAATVAIDKAIVNFSYSAVEGIGASITVNGSGQLTDDIRFKSFVWSFSYDKTTGWELKGNIQSALFEQEFALDASYRFVPALEKHCLSFQYSKSTTTPLISVPDLGSIDVKKLDFMLAKEKEATTFTFSAESELVVQNLLHLEGVLAFTHEKDSDVLSFTPKNAVVTIPVLDIPGSEKLTFVFEFGAVALTRETINGKSEWGFSASASFACPALNTVLPPYIKNIFPEKVTASFIARGKSVKFIADKVVDLQIDIPPIKLADDITVPVGLTRLSLTNLAINIDQDVSLSADLGLGLPAGFNTNFGTNEQGEPSVVIFNTFKPDNPDPTTVSLRLAVGTKGIKVKLLTSPFAFISFEEKDGKVWCYADLKDCGAVRFQVPEFALDLKTRSFIFNGGFEVVRELAIPLSWLKTLFNAAGTPDLANMLPNSLPIQQISLLDDNDKLDSEGYLTLFENICKVKPPEELKDVLKILETLVNSLPDDFRKYLKITIPKSFNFDIAITPENQGINVKMGVKKGDPPLRLLLPHFGLVPALVGIELYSFSLGEIFATNFLLMEVDARIDYFDLVTLAGALALGTDHQLPLPSSNEIQRHFIVEDFFVLIFTAIKIYGIPVPIPIPLFYKQLGVEYYGLEGVKAQAHIGLPKPELNAVGLVKTIKDLVMFVAKPEARLEPAALGEMDLKLNIGATYLQLPEYLGGKSIGTKKGVQLPGVYETIATVLNAIKFKSINELIKAIPYEYRVGTETIKFGPLSANATFLLTTPREFADGAYTKLAIAQEKTDEYVKLLPTLRPQADSALPPDDEEGLVLFLQGGIGIKHLIKGEAVFGLAASSSIGFQTGFKVSASILDLIDMELAGRISVNANKAIALNRDDMVKPPIKAVEFNGSDTFVRFPESVFDLASGLTVEFWVRVDETRADAVIFDFANPSATDAFTLQTGSTGGELILISMQEETKHTIEISNLLTVGAWTHLAFAIDGQNQCTVYKDGAPISDAAMTIPLPRSVRRSLNFIGKSAGDTGFFKGKLTDFRLWNRALSHETVKMYKDRRMSGSESGLTVYWPKGYGADGKNYEVIWRQKTDVLGPTWPESDAQNFRRLQPAGLLFATPNDYVNIGNPYKTADDFTLSLWVNPDKLNDGVAGIVGEVDSDERKPSLWMGGENGALCYEIVAESGQKYRGELAHFFTKPKKWVNICWVKQGDKSFFYRDGKAFAEAEAPAAFKRAGAKYFVGKVDTGWRGAIDEVQVWDRALSKNYIRANYGLLLTGFEPGLVGYWPFMEGIGRQTLDISSSFLSSIVGAKWVSEPVLVPKGVAFEGESAFIEAEYAKEAPLPLEDFTMEAWISPRTFAVANDQPGQDGFASFINAWTSSPANTLEVHQSTLDNFYWGLKGNTLYFTGIVENDNQEKAYLTATDTREIPADQWSHVAITRAKDKVTFYLNGVAQEPSDAVFPTGKIRSAPVSIRMGGQWRGESRGGFVGSLAELRIWRTARSASDLAEFKQKRLLGNEFDLSAYWPFRERCLAKSLDYVSQYHGVLHAVTWNDPFPFSFQGIRCNGSGDYIDLSDGIDIKTKFTFEAWVRGERGTIFERQGGADDKGRIAIRFNELFLVVTNEGERLSCPIQGLPINRWAHLAVSYDGKVMRVLVDGVEVNSHEHEGKLPASSGAAFIGVSNHDTRADAFKGAIDDIRIWNYERKSYHIKNQMYERLSGQEAGLVHYWPAVLGEGNTLFDLTGCNNGKLHGAVWDKQQYLNLTGRAFDGMNDVLTVNNPFTHPEEFTVSVWLKPTQINTGTVLPIMGNMVIGDDKRSPALWLGPAAGALYYEAHQATSGDKINYTGSIENFFLSSNQWVHLAWVKTGQRSFFYRNGQLVAEREAPAKVWVDEAAYEIGKGWNGLIDEVRIWDKARLADEIKGDMYFRIGPQHPGLIAYLPLGDRTYAAPSAAEMGKVLPSNEALFARPTEQTLNGLKFDGKEDYVDLGRGVPFSSNFTIEAWVNGRRGTLLQREENAQQKGYLELSFHNGFTLVTDDGTSYGLTCERPPIDEWIHLAATYDGETMRLYLNGKNVGSQHAPGKLSKSAAKTLIGKRMDDEEGTNFLGRLGEMRLWATARDAEEIAADMGRPLAGTEEGLVGYWPFSEGMGFTAFDKVGRNNGKLRGPSWLQSPFLSMEGVFFNGENALLNCGPTLSFQTEALTAELWFKADRTTGTSVLLNKANLLTLAVRDGHLQYSWGSDQPLEEGSYFPVQQGEWCHVACVYDGKDLALYKNGAKVFSRSDVANSVADASDLLLGARRQADAFADHFAGQMHSVKLWNYARDASEILVGRYKPLSGVESGLVGYWTLQQDNDKPFDNMAAKSVAQWSAGVIDDAESLQPGGETDKAIERILAGENAIEVAVGSAPFSAAGHAHLALLNQRIFSGDVLLQNDLFAFNGTLDLFPPGCPLQVKGAAKGVIAKNRFGFKSEVQATLFDFVLVGSKVEISEKGCWLTGTLLDQPVSLSLEKESDNRVVFKGSLDKSICLGELFQLSAGESGDLAQTGPKLLIAGPENPEFAFIGYLKVLGISQQTLLVFKGDGFVTQITGSLWGKFNTKLELKGTNLADLGAIEFTAEFENGLRELVVALKEQLSAIFNRAQQILGDARMVIQQSKQQLHDDYQGKKAYWEEEARKRKEEAGRVIDELNRKIADLQAEAERAFAEVRRFQEDIERSSQHTSAELNRADADVQRAKEEVNKLLDEIHSTENWYNSLPDIDWIWNPHKARDWIWVGPKIAGLWIAHGVATAALDVASGVLRGIDAAQQEAVKVLRFGLTAAEEVKKGVDALIAQAQEDVRQIHENLPPWVRSPELAIVEIGHSIAQGCLDIADTFVGVGQDLVSGIQYIAERFLDAVADFPIQITYAKFSGRIGTSAGMQFDVEMDIRYFDLGQQDFTTTRLTLRVDFADLVGTAARLLPLLMPSIVDNQAALEEKSRTFGDEIKAKRESEA